MLLRVGCEFRYDSPGVTPAVMLVQPHPEPPHRVVRETWEAEPAVGEREYLDWFGNRCRRFDWPVGKAMVRYDAEVEVSGEPDPVEPATAQVPVEALPDEVLVYTLASRYCLSDAQQNVAWHLFGGSEPGWARVQAVCDWIHDNIRYGQMKSTPLTTSVDVYTAGGGMCRDFAHLAITFCRALNIPARYVFGYMPDIGVPPPYPAMDFHAWFEAYLGDRWWAFDARFNVPRIGRIPIGIGRDAVDVAMLTTYGAARFERMTVWTELAEQDDARDDETETIEAGTTDEPDESEALVLEHGRA